MIESIILRKELKQVTFIPKSFSITLATRLQLEKAKEELDTDLDIVDLLDQTFPHTKRNRVITQAVIAMISQTLLTEYKFGEIYLVCFHPANGRELKKYRPAVIVSEIT